MNADSSNSPADAPAQSQRSLWDIFRAPVALGVLSSLGLVSALVGDGVFDGFSWIALGIPVAITVRYGMWSKH